MASYNLGSISGKIVIEYDPSSDGTKKAKAELDALAAAQRKADAELLAQQKAAIKAQELLAKQAAKEREQVEKLAAKSIADARKQADKDQLKSLQDTQKQAATLIANARKQEAAQQQAAAKEAQAIAVQANKDHLADIKDTQERSSAAVATAGKAMIGAGVGIAAALGVAVKVAADFEQQVSAIGAVSGATTEEMEQLRAAALRIGKDTSFSALDAAKAMEELAKAGVSTTDIISGAADATVSLAAAGGVALPKAAEIAANAMNLFKIKASDMPRVVDLIAGAANSSAISVEDFGFSMAQAGSAAALVGVSFDDMSVAITAMGKAGIKGSDAGTSLKTFLLNLQPTTAKQTTLMKELGIITEEAGNQFFDAGGNIKSMSKVAGVLEDALKGMTKEQKIATLETLFGSDAIRAAAIIADTGAKGFDDLAESMTKIKAADVAAKRLDNFKGSLEQLKGSAETFAIMIGTTLIPQLRKIIDSLTGVINWFSNLSDGTKEMIVRVLELSSAFLIVGGSVAYLVGKFKDIFSAFSLVTAIITGPGAIVLAILAALAAVAFVIQQNWDTIGPALAKVWNNVKKAAGDLVDWFKSNFGDKLKALWQQVQDAAKSIFGTIVKTVQDVQAKIKKAMSDNDFSADDVKKAINILLDVVKVGLSIYEGFVKGYITAIGKFVGGLIDAYSWISQRTSEFVDWFKSNFGDKLGEVWDKVVTAVKKFIADVSPVFADLKKAFTDFVDILKPAAQGIDEATDQAFGPDKAKKIQGTVDAIKIALDIFVEAFKIGLQQLTTVVKGIVGVVEGFLIFFRGIGETINGIATGNFGQIFEGLGDSIGGAFTIIITIIDTALNLISFGLFDKFKAKIGEIWRSIWTGLATAVLDGLAKIPEIIRERMFGISDEMLAKLRENLATANNDVKTGTDAVGATVTTHSQFVFDKLTGTWKEVNASVFSELDAQNSGMIEKTGVINSTLGAHAATVLSTLGTGWQMASDGTSARLGEMLATVNEKTGQIQVVIAGHGTFIYDETSKNWKRAADAAGNQVGVMQSDVQGKMQTINGAVSTHGNSVVGFVTEAWARAHRAEMEKTRDMAVTAARLGPEVAAAAGNMGGLLAPQGSAIVQGLINGMYSKQAEANAVAAAIGRTVASAMAAQLQVKSPSRVTAKIGGFATEGLAVGMENNEYMIKEAIANIAKTVAASSQVAMGSLMVSATSNFPNNFIIPEQAAPAPSINNFNVNNHNPVAETGTESTTRNLRRLALMGAFK